MPSSDSPIGRALDSDNTPRCKTMPKRMCDNSRVKCEDCLTKRLLETEYDLEEAKRKIKRLEQQVESLKKEKIG